MQKNIRIEKRIPFGFVGEWGQIYKRYVYDIKDISGYFIRAQNGVFKDIGQNMQLKYLDINTVKTVHVTELMRGAIANGEYCMSETTDAYFDDDSRTYKCIAEPEDIIYAFGEWWTVDKIEEHCIFTPKRHSFFYLGLKKIEDEIVLENK